jgi:F-type H+-transporting ATPase subunit delta
MSKDTRVARRYSAALFDIALRDDTVEVILTDLILVEAYLHDVQYLRAVLLQPLVSERQKIQVLSDAFGERTTATTLNFLYLLVRKRRENLVDEVIAAFRQLADDKAQRVSAHVQSAVPLSPEQLSQITAALEKRTGKNVRLTSEVTADIVGGLLVRIGDHVIDGTVRGRLLRVRQQLLGNL